MSKTNIIEERNDDAVLSTWTSRVFVQNDAKPKQADKQRAREHTATQETS